LLQQLSTDKASPYDITPEQARKARVYVALSLSALAPRMRYLERILQDPEVTAPVVHVRFGVNVAELFAQLDKALAGQNDHPPVQAWSPAARILRRPLPKDEGGAEKDQQRWMLTRLSVIPLEQFPKALPRDKGAVTQALIERFGTPFLTLLLDPQQPRDNVLRGRFTEASRALTNCRHDLKKQKERLHATPNLLAQVDEAVRDIINAEGQLQRFQREAGAGAAQSPAGQQLQKQREEVWKKGLNTIDVLIEGTAAVPLGLEVNFLLALAMHEQAERLQLRVDDAARAGKPAAGAEETRRACRSAWQNAADWWSTYLEEYADAPTAPAARFHASRAHRMLGEREAAIGLLRDVSGKLTDLEKVAHLYLARQLEQKK